jgi:hypothetical protein
MFFLADPCVVDGNPCLNGGTCQRIGTYGYACLCVVPYYGSVCEILDGNAQTTTVSTTKASTSNFYIFMSVNMENIKIFFIF